MRHRHRRHRRRRRRRRRRCRRHRRHRRHRHRRHCRCGGERRKFFKKIVSASNFVDLIGADTVSSQKMALQLSSFMLSKDNCVRQDIGMADVNR